MLVFVLFVLGDGVQAPGFGVLAGDPDTRTASFWLAIDDATVANGCLQFVPGTHREDRLRHHGPLHGDRDKSHTLVATLQPTDVPKVYHPSLLPQCSGHVKPYTSSFEAKSHAFGALL